METLGTDSEAEGSALIAEAIFVCEFHDTVGNAVVCCYPE